MKRGLAALCLLLALTTGELSAEKWSELKNVEPAVGRRVGWSLSIPADWVRVPEYKPPLSDGFRSPNSQAWFVVSWAGDGLPAAELSSLEQKGFQRKSLRVGGHDGLEFSRARKEGGLDRVVYARSPRGTCRIVLGASSSDFEAQLSQILTSFCFLDVAEPPRKPKGAVLEFEGARLPHPQDWQVQRLFGEATLTCNHKRVLTVSTLPGPGQGQSFRGYARGAGKLHLARAEKIAQFEPFQTASGVTGYLAVWSLESGGVSELSAYLPLGRGKTLVATLHDSTQGDAFRTMLEQFQSTR